MHGIFTFLDWCSNSSCMRCDLDLYIHPSNYRSRGLFYLPTCIVWCISSSSWRCCILSIVLGSSVSQGFYWPGVLYRWLLRLGSGPKSFQQHHLPFSLGVVQSISHHFISHKCSSHMVRDAGIGWWRISIRMAHTSLVYTERFRKPRRWQKVNVVGILFL